MRATRDGILYINGRRFRDVTGSTTEGGNISTCGEVRVLVEEGVRVAMSQSAVSEESASRETEPFWKQLPKYRKRKYRTHTGERHGHIT